MCIVVVGSINMDIVSRVHKHPLPGETIKGLGTEYIPGGKGANQAVAAARSGGNIVMIGAVGDDAFGSILTASLSGFGVQTEGVATLPVSSGIAIITVNAEGENNIILSEGANSQVDSTALDAHASLLDNADAVLLQNEIPWETNLCAMKMAYAKGAKVYYNPAPAMVFPDEIFAYLHALVMNETEAQVITGISVTELEEARVAMKLLIDKGVAEVIVTLGSSGSMYLNREGEFIHTPAFRVEVADTTAAGDSFIGAYAVAEASGKDKHESLRIASASAALTVSRKGAMVSIPSWEEVAAFLYGQ